MTKRILFVSAIAAFFTGWLWWEGMGCGKKTIQHRDDLFLIGVSGCHNVFSVRPNDVDESYFEVRQLCEKGDTLKEMVIVDSGYLVAKWDNNRWEIIDCERSLKVLIKSIQSFHLMNKAEEEPDTPAKFEYANFIADTIPKKDNYVMEFSDGVFRIYDNGVIIAKRLKNGTWSVVDTKRSLEIMYQKIYIRDSIRRQFKRRL